MHFCSLFSFNNFLSSLDCKPHKAVIHTCLLVVEVSEPRRGLVTQKGSRQYSLAETVNIVARKRKVSPMKVFAALKEKVLRQLEAKKIPQSHTI